MSNRIGAKAFWEAQEPDISAMLLNEDAVEQLAARDFDQIVHLFPSLAGQKVLELGAGIGRFTSYLARHAEHVTAVDLSEKFVDANRKTNGANPNVTFLLGDVTDISIDVACFDLIFSNWLLMYLEDAEAERFFDRAASWLKPGGCLFLRESCLTGSRGQPASPTNPGRYRDPSFYEQRLQERFDVIERGHILVYEEVYNNPNQLFWLLRSRTSRLPASD